MMRLEGDVYGKKITESDVIYRSIGDDFANGIISCGYMVKKTEERSQYNFMVGYYSCFLLLCGSGVYRDSLGNCLPIRTGDLVQRVPDICHSTKVVPDGEWLEFYISFGKGIFDSLKQLGLIETDSPVFHIGFRQEDRKRFDWLLSRLKAAGEEELPDVLLDAQRLVYELHRRFRSDKKTAYAPEIRKGMALLSDNLSEEIPMEQIAEAVQMGYEHFRKLFREQVGSAPNVYRTEQRMRQSRIMLLAGQSIADIAPKVGYVDCYSFSKQFKKTVGMPPAAYRREHT